MSFPIYLNGKISFPEIQNFFFQHFRIHRKHFLAFCDPLQFIATFQSGLSQIFSSLFVVLCYEKIQSSKRDTRFDV